jgi:hypothetical protein
VSGSSSLGGFSIFGFGFRPLFFLIGSPFSSSSTAFFVFFFRPRFFLGEASRGSPSLSESEFATSSSTALRFRPRFFFSDFGFSSTVSSLFGTLFTSGFASSNSDSSFSSLVSEFCEFCSLSLEVIAESSDSKFRSGLSTYNIY